MPDRCNNAPRNPPAKQCLIPPPNRDAHQSRISCCLCVAVWNLWRRKGRLLVLVISTKVGCPRHFHYPHVWTVPSWQGLFSRCRLVSAAVCSAFGRGSHDRWPQCPPRIRSRSKARVRECMGVRPALQRPVGPPKLHITPDVRRNRFLITLALDHMAQAILAILLRSAMATILVGHRSNNAASQDRCCVQCHFGVADDGESAGHE
jgi:hypothetical protein